MKTSAIPHRDIFEAELATDDLAIRIYLQRILHTCISNKLYGVCLWQPAGPRLAFKAPSYPAE